MLFRAHHCEHTDRSTKIFSHIPFFRQQAEDLPKRTEDSRIPVVFLKSTAVDGLDTFIHAVDGYFRRAQSHNGSQFLVGSMNGPIIFALESLPYYPRRRYTCSRVCIGNLTQRRQKCRVYNVFVYDNNGEENDSNQRDRRGCHIASVPFS